MFSKRFDNFMEEVNEHYFRGFQRIFLVNSFTLVHQILDGTMFCTVHTKYKSFSNNIFTVTVNKPYKVLGYPAKAGGTAL